MSNVVEIWQHRSVRFVWMPDADYAKDEWRGTETLCTEGGVPVVGLGVGSNFNAFQMLTRAAQPPAVRPSEWERMQRPRVPDADYYHAPRRRFLYSFEELMEALYGIKPGRRRRL